MSNKSDRKKEKELKEKTRQVARNAFENGYTLDQLIVDDLDQRVSDSILLAWVEFLADEDLKGSPVVLVS